MKSSLCTWARVVFRLAMPAVSIFCFCCKKDTRQHAFGSLLCEEDNTDPIIGELYTGEHMLDVCFFRSYVLSSTQSLSV